MIRNGLHLIVIAALSASPLMAQSPASPKTPKSVSDNKRAPDKVLPMKGTSTVNSCAAYGAGFVKVEGTDTCVQIGGSISIGVGGSTRR
jgi:Porin subfamily